MRRSHNRVFTIASPVLALITALLVLTATAASAAVITDRWAYQAGDTVHITGDGMQPEEPVGVDVGYPDGSLAQHHDVTADGAGNFADTYVIQVNDPTGIYTVTATGQTSGNVFTTTFDPAPPGCDITANSPTNITATGFDISWSSNCINPNGGSDSQFNIYNSAGDVVAGPYYLNQLPTSGNNDDPYGPETITGLTCGSSDTYYVGVEWEHPQTPLAKSGSVSVTTAACVSSIGTTVELGAPTNHVAVDLVNGAAYHSTVHDAATVSSSANIPANSSVTFDFYPNGSCDTADTPTSDSVDLTGGSTSETVYSSETAQLAAGDYSYLASFTSGDTTKVANSTADCEPFTVNAPPAITPTISTEIRDANGGTGTGTPTPHFPLGTTVHDHATLTVSSGDPAEGTVTFKLYSGTLCTGTTPDTQVGSTDGESLAGTDAGEKDSTTFGPLHAGDYYFLVTYTSGDTSKWNSVTTPTCEQMTIDKADTSITTSVSPFVLTGVPVHDTSSVSSTNTSGFTFAGTSNLTYYFYANGTCTGTPASETLNYPSDSSNHTISTPGSYCFKASYLGNSDYNGSNSAIEPFTVVPPTAVTDSSLCPFDTDTGTAGSQFNLIYTPDVNAPTYKLNASNPGQFYDNGFYIGTGNTNVTFTIPLPFVTQGAVPIHVYSSVAFGPGGCLIPGTEIANSNYQLTLTSGRTITVHIPAVAGFAYIAIHLDYGYKGYDNCTKDANTLKATCATPSATILNGQSYSFSSSLGPNVTVSNVNIFKKDPGIGGLVTHLGNPVAGATVKIYDGSNHLLTTVTTDSDGWYMWAYKYTGKAASFVVKTGTASQPVTLKSNGYLIVNFAV